MTYKVYKANGTKCVKTFESIDEAKSWIWTRDNGNTYRIEYKYEDEEEPRKMYC